MGKRRDRENPCDVCEHYHNHEAGEACGICGHRIVAVEQPTQPPSAFPSEILPEFLYLGSYDNSAQENILKNQLGISHALNTVPNSHNLIGRTTVYHCLPEGEGLDFEDAIAFLRKCEEEKGRVLVYCMTGKSRSPAVVIAYLMKTKEWRFEKSLQWVKERRPCVELSQAVRRQLLEFETKVFSSVESAPFGGLTISEPYKLWR